jgi:hypothetical protein
MEAQLSNWLVVNLDALAVDRRSRGVLETDDSVVCVGHEAQPVVSIRGGRGQWVRLHSSRNPLAEADRLLSDLLGGADVPEAVVAVGLGMGYVLDAIERRAPHTRVLAVEPQPALARVLLQSRDWRRWIAAGRLNVIWGPDWRGATDAWRILGDAAVEPPVLVNPVLAREWPADIAEARSVASRIAFGARANLNARKENAGRYLLNTLRNAPALACEGDVAGLFGRFEQVPAVLAAAGPSLDSNIEVLERVVDRVVLIAADTALRPLLSAGIEPHLVVGLDPSETNGRHLVDLPELPNTWLVAEGSLDPEALPAFAGRIFGFQVSDHHPWPWLRSVGFARDRLRAWGSVLTSAFDLALKAGCDPIVFVGADLAYTGGQPYCRGTTFEDDWARWVVAGWSVTDLWRGSIDSRGPVSVPGIEGRAVETAPHLLAFREWIVEQVAANPTRSFVNATGAGVLSGEGLRLASLLELEARERLDRRVLGDRLQRAWHGARPPAESHRVTTAISAIVRNPGQHQSLLEEWSSFALVGTDRIAEALADALAWSSVSAPVSCRPTGRSRLWAPHRAAVIAHVLSETPVPAELAGADRPRWTGAVEAPEELFRHALGRLSELLDDGEPLLRPQPTADATNSIHTSEVPASLAFDWSPVAAWKVREFEDGLADAVLLRQSRAVPRDEAVVHTAVANELGTRVERRTTPSAAVGAFATDQPEGGARLALVREWLGAMAQSPAERAMIRLLRALTASPAGVACERGAEPSDASCEVTLTGNVSGCPPWRASGVLPGSSLPYTLVGALACYGRDPRPRDQPADSAGAPADELVLHCTGDPASLPELAVRLEVRVRGRADVPGHRWFRPGGTWVDARDLCREGLPVCWIAATRPGSARALVTHAGGLLTYEVNEDGTFEAAKPWPRPVNGAVPWGDHGGTVAWYHIPDRYLFFRSAAGALTQSEQIPFAPSLAFPRSDGSIWFTAASGGLWSWQPGGGCRLLVDTPSIIGLQERNGVVRLDPYVPGRLLSDRVKVSKAYSWRPGENHLGSLPLDEDGQVWASSRSGDWLALGYPHADVVRLEHRDGRVAELSCPHPFTVAWAGRSLLVTHGPNLRQVWFFRDLLTVVEAVRITSPCL